MTSLHSSLYAIALMSCLLCSVLAGRHSRQPTQRFFYLGVFLGVQSLAFVCEWLLANPASPAKSLWLGSLMAMSFLFAPLLWLYAREVSEPERPAIRSLPARHVLVIAGGVLLALPLLSSTHFGVDYANPNRATLSSQILFTQGCMLVAVFLFLMQAAWYMRMSHRILITSTGAGRALIGPIESKPLHALRLILWVVGTHWIVNALRAVHCLTLGRDTGLGVLFALAQMAVTVWALLSLMRTADTLGFASLAPACDVIAEPIPPPRPSSKYARSALDASTRARIRRKLDAALTRQRLHADSALSLPMLCGHLQENPHYVSQVLNQDLATSFHELVNRHRIQDASRALLDEPGKTVLEIALQSGFNSKSTFNAAFRQHTGTTPSAYRESHARPPSS